jgi:hypothetical protein
MHSRPVQLILSAGLQLSSGQLVCAATAEVQAGSMYDRPQLYDDAFSYRDFTAEVSRYSGDDCTGVMIAQRCCMHAAAEVLRHSEQVHLERGVMHVQRRQQSAWFRSTETNEHRLTNLADDQPPRQSAELGMYSGDGGSDTDLTPKEKLGACRARMLAARVPHTALQPTSCASCHAN